ncbi:MAG: phosphotransferase [Candidatus Thermoplasmatota archaeon]|nr:phosphotransferase [Candidatus Thermoplasmatota archaeon]
MIISADLHIHSPYTKRGAHPISLKDFATNAKTKGLDIIGTGDCLHPRWMQQIQQLPEIEDGTYEYQNVKLILTTEIETNDNIHHLILFPDKTAVTEFRKKIKPFTSTISTHGRPKIGMDSVRTAEHAIDVGALIGPAHIFDSYSGLYSRYPSIKECYQYMTNSVAFIELGLAGNTYLADKIHELHEYTFLSNSDTHNPHPIRLAREFTQFAVKKTTFNELSLAIKRKNGNKPVLNIGIPPQEGKYFDTACKKCHMRYSFYQAAEQQWKCDCGGLIKKGVSDSIAKKASYQPSQHPIHRPQYASFLPLHEIITRVYHEQNPFTDTVTQQWNQLVNTFGSEINTLFFTPLEDLSKIIPTVLIEAIQSFRNATVHFHPGGGGTYGSVTIPWEEPKFTITLNSERKTR